MILKERLLKLFITLLFFKLSLGVPKNDGQIQVSQLDDAYEPRGEKQTLSSTNKSEKMCGNGILDEGEECDPGIDKSSECCTNRCTRETDLETLCEGGRGICRAGRCVSRRSQCASLDNKILTTKGTSLVGPFVPCNPNLENDVESSTLNTQLQCTLSCQGRIKNSATDRQCLDFNLYRNIENLVADGVICGNDSKGSSLGVCEEGVCKTENCRFNLCNGRGDCYRSDNSTVKCNCDDSYSGEKCERSSGCDGIVDRCGVCNGNGTTCPKDPSSNENQPFVSSFTFRNIVLPILIVAGIIIFAALGYYSYRRTKGPAPVIVAAKTNPSSFQPETRVHPSNKRRNFFNFRASKGQNFGISVRFDEFQAIADYEARLEDELELREGDIVFKLYEYDDGWAKGYNTRSKEEGVFPVAFTEKVASNLEENLKPMNINEIQNE